MKRKTTIKQKLKRLKHTLESCILCIRFPFLYPRNRFTDNHWDSHKIQNYLYGTSESFEYTTNEKGEVKRIPIPAKQGIYQKAYEHVPIQNLLGVTTVRKSLFYACLFHVVKFIHDYILAFFHCIPTFTELDAMSPGWKKAFGIQMCKDIRKQLIKDHYLFEYRITQIKSKYGGLRWYDSAAPKAVHDIIEKYEELSYNTCETCGKQATIFTAGWNEAFCENCYKEANSPYIIQQRKINGKWEYTKEYLEIESKL